MCFITKLLVSTCNDHLRDKLYKNYFEAERFFCILGYIQGINGLILAEAAGSLGAGITSIGQKIDHSVGFRLLKTVGHRIKVNEPWVEIHFSSELDDDLRLNVENALSVSSASVESKDFLIQVISQG